MAHANGLNMSVDKVFECLNLQISFLVLAFERAAETKLLLQSIKQHVKFDRYEVILLVNGGNQTSFLPLYQEGLCDKLILSRTNEGSGGGTVRLIQACATELFIYLQNDNFFQEDLTQEHLTLLKILLDTPDIAAVDFTGLVPRCHHFSERAFAAKKSYYLSNDLLRVGGTGPFQHVRGTEPTFYDFFSRDKKYVASFSSWIGDSGVYSIVETPCGGKLRIRTDTHELSIIEIPKKPMPMFNLSGEEWDQIIAGKWVNGTIPKQSEGHVFFMFRRGYDYPIGKEHLKQP